MKLPIEDASKPILPIVWPSGKENKDTSWKLGKPFLPEQTANSPIVSGVAYCVVSAMMVLLNKFALSGFQFNCPNSLLLLQCGSAIIFVKTAELLGFWKLQKVRWDIVKVWIPVNIFFVMMLATGVWSLQLLGVGMVTIMKNLTNLVTITGDYFFYKRTYNIYVWLTLALITLSAFFGASTDLSFTWRGYSAQLLNCVFTAGYSLLLRGVMDRVTIIQGEKMDTESQVLYNNLLSIPFVVILVVLFDEPQRLLQEPALTSPAFHFVVFLSCVAGFSISYTTLWFLSNTTPTTYGLVGSLNKIPVAVIGILLFNTQTSLGNMISICIGLTAGVLFVRAKQTQ